MEVMPVARLVLLVLIAALLGAAPASADEVLMLGRDGKVTAREDRFLPAADLPAPPAARARRPVASAAARRTVVGELKRLYGAGRITVEEYRLRRDIYYDAVRKTRRLSGARRVQMRAVLGTLEAIAARKQLTLTRLPALWLTLDRNLRWWYGGERLLGSGTRVEFEGSELVWQYYPGQGLQLQVLGNFGKLNGLVTGYYYDRAGFLMDELLPLAASRAGGIAWEYYFAFGGGRPPWVSGMAQGTAVQALARAAHRLGRRDEVLPVAAQALPLFERRTPTGVRVPATHGDHYALYSFAPSLRVANGFVQSLVGLHDYARISGDPRGAAAFARADPQLRRELPTYDTGAWSLYSRGSSSRESDLHYHDLLQDFVGDLCRQTATPVYCETAQRFLAYRMTPPAIAVWQARLRGGDPGRVRFRLSKISSVTLSISRGARVVETRAFGTVAHGTRSFGWAVPRRKGRYTVTLTARDLAGNVGSGSATAIVLKPKRRS
ncbi:MAG: D-glucuronyl C5-epimerase family protein [Solirubrobacteraceae bacterium]